MNPRFLIALFILSTALAAPLQAQVWDPNHQAAGWAFQEVDGSMIFFDPTARSLRTWIKGGGLLGTLPVALPEPKKAAAPKAPPRPRAQASTEYDAAGALLYGISRHPRTPDPVAQEPTEASAACDAVPERWVQDCYNRIWLVCGDRLALLGKDGKPDSLFTLPGSVEDLAAGQDGIFILYRTLRPYLEKRDLKTGEVLWAFGDKAQVEETRAHPLRVPLNRMALSVDGTVYLAEGASLAFTVLDPDHGPKAPGQTFFTCQDAIPPRAVLGPTGRGPVLTWPGRGVVFGVFAPSQVKTCGAPDSKGLLLARFDLLKGTLDWLPTPLAEGHRLVGLLDSEAVFVAPGGGLAYAPIR